MRGRQTSLALVLSRSCMVCMVCMVSVILGNLLPVSLFGFSPMQINPPSSPHLELATRFSQRRSEGIEVVVVTSIILMMGSENRGCSEEFTMIQPAVVAVWSCLTSISCQGRRQSQRLNACLKDERKTYMNLASIC